MTHTESFLPGPSSNQLDYQQEGVRQNDRANQKLLLEAFDSYNDNKLKEDDDWDDQDDDSDADTADSDHTASGEATTAALAAADTNPNIAQIRERALITMQAIQNRVRLDGTLPPGTIDRMQLEGVSQQLQAPGNQISDALRQMVRNVAQAGDSPNGRAANVIRLINEINHRLGPNVSLQPQFRFNPRTGDLESIQIGVQPVGQANVRQRVIVPVN